MKFYKTDNGVVILPSNEVVINKSYELFYETSEEGKDIGRVFASVTKNCEFCKEEFIGRFNQLYCSALCQRKKGIMQKQLRRDLKRINEMKKKEIKNE